MNTRKYHRAARAGAQSFSTAAAVVSLAFDVVSSFFSSTIPGFCKWVVAGVIGLVAGCFGGRNALQAEEEKDRQREVRRNAYVELVGDVKQELDDLKASFDVKGGRDAKHVEGRVQAAYQRVDNLHARVSAANSRFFQSGDGKSTGNLRSSDSKYGSYSSDDEDEKSDKKSMTKYGTP